MLTLAIFLYSLTAGEKVFMETNKKHTMEFVKEERHYQSQKYMICVS